MARETEAVHKVEADAALAEEGLQKAKDGKTVEPFVTPEVEPFAADKDGVIDLKATRASDLAKKVAQAYTSGQNE